MRLAICGPARAGKDEAAEWFVKHCGLRYFGSTSRVIWPYVADRLGMTMEEAWESRNSFRVLWRVIGDELRKDDPAYLARRVLRHGQLCVGIRSLGEIQTVADESLVDWILWIDRDVPKDPTLEYDRTAPFIDFIVPNYGSVAEFHRRLAKLARGWGLI